MTRLGDFSDETLAVDTVAADIELLEKLAARGGSLSEQDLGLLARCHARLSRLLPMLAANGRNLDLRSAPVRKRPVKLKKGRRSLMKHHVNSA